MPFPPSSTSLIAFNGLFFPQKKDANQKLSDGYLGDGEIEVTSTKSEIAPSNNDDVDAGITNSNKSRQEPASNPQEELDDAEKVVKNEETVGQVVHLYTVAAKADLVSPQNNQAKGKKKSPPTKKAKSGKSGKFSPKKKSAKALSSTPATDIVDKSTSA